MHEEAGDYVWGGARALVALHEQHLRAFVATWKEARRRGVVLPPTDDPTCVDLPAVLAHVLRAARGYLVWLCRCLGLPDPGIEPVPEDPESALDAWLEHLLARWALPLRTLDAATAERSVFPSSWGTPYCLDAMLEHAVMHPIRHQHQLQRAAASC